MQLVRVTKGQAGLLTITTDNNTHTRCSDIPLAWPEMEAKDGGGM